MAKAKVIPVSLKPKSELNAAKELVGKQLQAGDNEIKAQSTSGLRLIVTATANKNLGFRVVDAKGKPVRETSSYQVTTRSANKAKTTCWECGKDAAGNTHCWKIPCPVIVGPWTPGKVIEATDGFITL